MLHCLFRLQLTCTCFVCMIPHADGDLLQHLSLVLSNPASLKRWVYLFYAPLQLAARLCWHLQMKTQTLRQTAPSVPSIPTSTSNTRTLEYQELSSSHHMSGTCFHTLPDLREVTVILSYWHSFKDSWHSNTSLRRNTRLPSNDSA